MPLRTRGDNIALVQGKPWSSTDEINVIGDVSAIVATISLTPTNAGFAGAASETTIESR